MLHSERASPPAAASGLSSKEDWKHYERYRAIVEVHNGQFIKARFIFFYTVWGSILVSSLSIGSSKTISERIDSVFCMSIAELLGLYVKDVFIPRQCEYNVKVSKCSVHSPAHRVHIWKIHNKIRSIWILCFCDVTKMNLFTYITNSVSCLSLFTYMQSISD